jgi:hypothetical protein
MEKAAVLAVKEYLIELLNDEKWCEAQKVGEALRILVYSQKNLARPTISDSIMVGGGMAQIQLPNGSSTACGRKEVK